MGVRRFPVREVYLDDLTKEVALAPSDVKKVNSLLQQCGKLRGKQTPPTHYLEKVHAVVSNLATVLGEPGSSVLIFVPGMNDSKWGKLKVDSLGYICISLRGSLQIFSTVVTITEHIENIHKAGIKFNCVPIHSDIPFEDQMVIRGCALVHDNISIIS